MDVESEDSAQGLTLPQQLFDSLDSLLSSKHLGFIFEAARDDKQLVSRFIVVLCSRLPHKRMDILSAALAIEKGMLLKSLFEHLMTSKLSTRLMDTTLNSSMFSGWVQLI